MSKLGFNLIENLLAVVGTLLAQMLGDHFAEFERERCSVGRSGSLIQRKLPHTAIVAALSTIVPHRACKKAIGSTGSLLGEREHFEAKFLQPLLDRPPSSIESRALEWTMRRAGNVPGRRSRRAGPAGVH